MLPSFILARQRMLVRVDKPEQRHTHSLYSAHMMLSTPRPPYTVSHRHPLSDGLFPTLLTALTQNKNRSTYTQISHTSNDDFSDFPRRDSKRKGATKGGSVPVSASLLRVEVSGICIYIYAHTHTHTHTHTHSHTHSHSHSHTQTHTHTHSHTCATHLCVCVCACVCIVPVSAPLLGVEVSGILYIHM